MQVRQLIQQILDAQLLKSGIMSHHLRFVESTQIKDASGNLIKVNNDEHVVYRIVSSRNRVFGEGKARARLYYIDINYYYTYNKNDARITQAASRIDSIIKAFLADRRFKLVNGQSDLPDIDNPFRGINIEVSFLEVVS